GWLPREWNRGRLTVDHKRPCQPLGGRKLFRHVDDEHAGLTSGKKMRRLAHIGTAGIDMVVGADRYVDVMRPVHVDVANEEVVPSVLVVEPAFERSADAHAELSGWIVRKLSR